MVPLPHQPHITKEGVRLVYVWGASGVFVDLYCIVFVRAVYLWNKHWVVNYSPPTGPHTTCYWVVTELLLEKLLGQLKKSGHFAFQLFPLKQLNPFEILPESYFLSKQNNILLFVATLDESAAPPSSAAIVSIFIASTFFHWRNPFLHIFGSFLWYTSLHGWKPEIDNMENWPGVDKRWEARGLLLPHWNLFSLPLAISWVLVLKLFLWNFDILIPRYKHSRKLSNNYRQGLQQKAEYTKRMSI